MRTIFRYTLTRFWGQVLGWGLALFLLGAISVARYDIMRDNQEPIKEILKGSAGRFIGMFGDPTKLMSPEGFLSLAFFSYLPLILGVFAVLAGSGLLAADEENGILDLILAHPVSRTALFLGRLLAFVAATMAILALSWLGFIVAMRWSSLAVGWGAMALPFLSLLAVLLFFGTLALLLSMVLPSRRLAAMTAGMVLVLSYFLTTLARLDTSLETVAKLSPTYYYQSGEAILGLKGEWFGGLLAVAGLFSVVAWWRFERRDIRVVGEGVWRWPWWPGHPRERVAECLTGARPGDRNAHRP
ncbi:MAG: ABC transporter permease subunit [Planctomycetes bacterium]|nr:ABC transporter permease subunit [Planctomycetota bacterium]